MIFSNTTGSSCRNIHRQTASYTAADTVMHSSYFVDKTSVDCRRQIPEIGPPDFMKTYSSDETTRPNISTAVRNIESGKMFICLLACCRWAPFMHREIRFAVI